MSPGMAPPRARPITHNLVVVLAAAAAPPQPPNNHKPRPTFFGLLLLGALSSLGLLLWLLQYRQFFFLAANNNNDDVLLFHPPLAASLNNDSSLLPRVETVTKPTKDADDENIVEHGAGADASAVTSPLLEKESYVDPQQQQPSAAAAAADPWNNNNNNNHDIIPTEEDEHKCNFLLEDDNCLQRVAHSLRRVWPRKPIAQWCNSTTTTSNASNSSGGGGGGSGSGGGLLLTKVPKSASSTAAAVVLRLQHHLRCTTNNDKNGTAAAVQWQHGRASELYRHIRNPNNNSTAAATSLLLAPLRNPNTRALSSVYFHTVSFHGRSSRIRHNNNNNNSQSRPADKFIIRKLAELPSNYITDYVSLIPLVTPETDDDATANNNTHANNDAGSSLSSSWFLTTPWIEDRIIRHDGTLAALVRQQIQQTVQSIMQSYDFLLVAERLDESLVALAGLLGLLDDDDDDNNNNNNNSNHHGGLSLLVTLSSKVSGQRSPRAAINTPHSSWYASHGQCWPLVPPVVTPAIQSYWESSEWKIRHAADRLLHATAVASLNATILDQYQQFLQKQKHQQQPQSGAGAEEEGHVWSWWNARLARFRAMKHAAVTACASQTHFPCSANGTLQLSLAQSNCYWRDLGCGYPCLDRVLASSSSSLQQQQQDQHPQP